MKDSKVIRLNDYKLELIKEAQELQYKLYSGFSLISVSPMNESQVIESALRTYIKTLKKQIEEEL